MQSGKYFRNLVYSYYLLLTIAVSVAQSLSFFSQISSLITAHSLERQIPLRIVGYHFTSRLTATLNLCLIYLKLLVDVL